MCADSYKVGLGCPGCGMSDGMQGFHCTVIALWGIRYYRRSKIETIHQQTPVINEMQGESWTGAQNCAGTLNCAKINPVALQQQGLGLAL